MMAQFLPIDNKTSIMMVLYSSNVTKKLAVRFVLDNIDYRKKCLYLQEIISLGKIKDVWRQALISYLDTPFDNLSLKVFSKN
jgi:hypothetical protein